MKTKAHKRFLPLFSMVLFSLILSTKASKAGSAQIETKIARVTGDVVNVRTGAGINYPTAFQVKIGDIVTIILISTKIEKIGKHTGSWYKIRNSDNKTGFIFSAFLENSKFRDNGNGTITDTKTGLMWQQDGKASGQLKWEAAMEYCKKLHLAGFSDWRAPTKYELVNLIYTDGIGENEPNLWLNHQGFKNVQSEYYWSGSTSAISTGNAWFVHMSDGYVNYGTKIGYNYVLGVRSGQ